MNFATPGTNTRKKVNGGMLLLRRVVLLTRMKSTTTSASSFMSSNFHETLLTRSSQRRGASHRCEGSAFPMADLMFAPKVWTKMELMKNGNYSVKQGRTHVTAAFARTDFANRVVLDTSGLFGFDFPAGDGVRWNKTGQQVGIARDRTSTACYSGMRHHKVSTRHHKYDCIRTDGVRCFATKMSLNSEMEAHAPSSSSAVNGGNTISISIPVLRQSLDDIEMRLSQLMSEEDRDSLKRSIDALEKDCTSSDVWNNQSKAMRLMKQLDESRAEVTMMDEMWSQHADCTAAMDIIKEFSASSEGNDRDVDSDYVALMRDTMKEIDALTTRLEEVERVKLLAGQFDKLGAVLTISAGAGGDDAAECAAMLVRMYERWADKKGFKTKITFQTQDAHGIKNCTLEVKGDYAYGLCAMEKGTHRIVRQSPFNKARHTSFVGVEVMPLLEEEDHQLNLEIRDDELEVTTMKTGGPGGQNVNKLETGVRIKHIPTQITVKCTAERTQGANKSIAMKYLMSKLILLREEESRKQMAEIRGEAVKAEWGQQIRNYVFHPYKIIKDLRTNVETSDVGSVLDGDIDGFINAALQWHCKKNA